MRSYTTLAVLALAVSTASPAFSAPVLAFPGDLGSDIATLLKSINSGNFPRANEIYVGRREPSLGSILKSLKKFVGVGQSDPVQPADAGEDAGGDADEGEIPDDLSLDTNGGDGPGEGDVDVAEDSDVAED